MQNFLIARTPVITPVRWIENEDSPQENIIFFSNSKEVVLTPQRNPLTEYDSPSYFINQCNYFCSLDTPNKIQNYNRIEEEENMDDIENSILDNIRVSYKQQQYNQIIHPNVFHANTQALINNILITINQVRKKINDEISVFSDEEDESVIDLMQGLSLTDKPNEEFLKNDGSPVYDISAQLKKSKREDNSDESMAYQLVGGQWKRIFNCQHCDQLFGKACSLGGHMSRVHSKIVQQLKKNKIHKKKIPKVRKVR